MVLFEVEIPYIVHMHPAYSLFPPYARSAPHPKISPLTFLVEGAQETHLAMLDKGYAADDRDSAVKNW